MGNPAHRQATYEDILKLPPNVVGELLGGELVVSPRPRPSHAYATGELFGELHGRFGRGGGGPAGWIFLVEPELHLGPHILVPDIAGWRARANPVLTNEQVWLEEAPDWVCEVLSPSTEKYDRTHKLKIYATEGVGHVWLVSPANKTLEAMALASRVPPRWTSGDSYLGDDKVRAQPFEEFELDLGQLWLK